MESTMFQSKVGSTLKSYVKVLARSRSRFVASVAYTTVVESRQDVQSVIFGRNPGHPGEGRKGCENVVWKPKVAEHPRKRIHEEAVTGHGEYLLEWSGTSDIAIIVQSSVESDHHERRRPETVRRVD